MSYTALYRAWRPALWQEVVNQKPVIRILQNALSEGKVSHAYIFSGPRGTGKTTVARLLAKSVNCRDLKGGEPCNACPSCTSISDGSSVDVIEIDAASNRGIDDVRSLRESVRYVPVTGKHKVYIIDEVHMLTSEAFNALLKTVEEPPAHVIFIMATTAPHKIPVTITSRCQRLDFRRLSVQDIEGQLGRVVEQGRDGVSWEKGALRLIARAAGGSMRDALSILDVCLIYGEGKLTESDVRDVLGETGPEIMQRLFRALSERDFRAILETTAALGDRGKDMGELADEMGAFGRDLLFLSAGGKAEDLGRPEDEVDDMLLLARSLSTETVLSVLDALSRCQGDMRNSNDPRLVLETALMGTLLKSTTAPVRQEVREVVRPRAEVPKPKLPTGDDPLQLVKVKWEDLLKLMQQKREVLVRAYLLHATPVKVSGSKLVLEFPPGYTTLAEQISSKGNKEIAESYLKELTGISFDIVTEITREGSPVGGALHPLVKGAIGLIDGKIVG